MYLELGCQFCCHWQKDVKRLYNSATEQNRWSRLSVHSIHTILSLMAVRLCINNPLKRINGFEFFSFTDFSLSLVKLDRYVSMQPNHPLHNSMISPLLQVVNFDIDKKFQFWKTSSVVYWSTLSPLTWQARVQFPAQTFTLFFVLTKDSLP